jgi:hypothetical protein
MAVEYSKANAEIQDAAWDLIGKQHPDLGGTLNKGDIVVVFREKASKAGGQVMLGTARKAQPLVNALAGESFVFIVELAMDQWSSLDAKQREACLDHYLCACRADHDEKTGKTKFYVSKPPIQAYPENVERYGMWFPKDDDGDDGDDKDDPVGDMFGVDDE